MIKPVRAWADSQGVFHTSREAACKAEFRRLLLDSGWFMLESSASDENDLVAALDTLVENMFSIDKMIGEATKEDTRADVGLQSDAS